MERRSSRFCLLLLVSCQLSAVSCQPSADSQQTVEDAETFQSRQRPTKEKGLQTLFC